MVALNLLSTIEGSLLRDFFPRGWDLQRIDACCGQQPEEILQRQPWWNSDFAPEPCDNFGDFEVRLGHEIALEISRTREVGQELILILPVGPMGMYRWIVYFLSEWGVSASHVHGFSMDEWSDADGNTLASDAPGAFEGALTQAFYGLLGGLSVPKDQRHFATRHLLRVSATNRCSASPRSAPGHRLRRGQSLPCCLLGAALRC